MPTASTYPSSEPAATSHNASAAEPRARNCFQASGCGGRPARSTTASSTACTGDGTSASPSRRAPPPRTAVVTEPVAWLRTSEQSRPSASSAQSEIAQYGIPREQLVDPSTGSTTTVTGASGGPLHPDSSLTTATS